MFTASTKPKWKYFCAELELIPQKKKEKKSFDVKTLAALKAEQKWWKSPPTIYVICSDKWREDRVSKALNNKPTMQIDYHLNQQYNQYHHSLLSNCNALI